MVIRGGTNYGRVGVGTNSPGSQLDVFDNTDIISAGDDIAFKAYEQLALTNTVNRAVATVIHAEEGTTTIGSEITVDSYNTVNTNKQMVGVFTGIRGTDVSGYVSDAIGYRAFVDYSDNYAIRKYGIQALVGHATPSNTANTYGGYFAAQSAYGNNYGGYFVASASTGNEYGVYASAPSQCTGTSPSITCSGAAGYFSGDMYATGLYGSSDLRLKDQINTVNDANAILSQMECKQFVFKTQAYPQMNLPQGSHYGFIAQDVEAILPGLVRNFTQPAIYDSIGLVITPEVDFKAVNYVEFVPLLVAAVKEQKNIIDSLINALQNPTPIINPQNQQKVTLSNVSSIILNQNDPNPFTESTRITYQIPEDVREAKIIFTNSSGSIINTVIVNERGTGELEVYSSDMSKGIYNYTLVCDGNVIATKKMVKQ